MRRVVIMLQHVCSSLLSNNIPVYALLQIGLHKDRSVGNRLTVIHYIVRNMATEPSEDCSVILILCIRIRYIHTNRLGFRFILSIVVKHPLYRIPGKAIQVYTLIQVCLHKDRLVCHRFTVSENVLRHQRTERSKKIFCISPGCRISLLILSGRLRRMEYRLIPVTHIGDTADRWVNRFSVKHLIHFVH